MIRQATVLPGAKVKLTGDVSSLLEQIGSPEDNLSARAITEAQDLTNLDSIRTFLRTYELQVLLPIELPAIARAFFHLNRNEARELIALDKALGADPRLSEHAAPSQRVGQIHLQRLRPMRDCRVVQRYLQAVENGEALGFHTLVYGLTLAIYSIPLRQGLIAYGEQTLGSFAQLAGRKLGLPDTESLSLANGFTVDLPAAVEAILAPKVL